MFRRRGERNVVPQQPNGGNKEEREDSANSQEGAGPRFQKGSEDLDQLEGIENNNSGRGKHGKSMSRPRRGKSQILNPLIP